MCHSVQRDAPKILVPSPSSSSSALHYLANAISALFFSIFILIAKTKKGEMEGSREMSPHEINILKSLCKGDPEQFKDASKAVQMLSSVRWREEPVAPRLQ